MIIAYHRKTKIDDIRWRDGVIVTNESGKFVIDDIIYDVDAGVPRQPHYLSSGFEGCAGAHWIE